jgi:hypothetical protein
MAQGSLCLELVAGLALALCIEATPAQETGLPDAGSVAAHSKTPQLGLRSKRRMRLFRVPAARPWRRNDLRLSTMTIVTRRGCFNGPGFSVS